MLKPEVTQEFSDVQSPVPIKRHGLLLGNGGRSGESCGSMKYQLFEGRKYILNVLFLLGIYTLLGEKGPRPSSSSVRTLGNHKQENSM